MSEITAIPDAAATPVVPAASDTQTPATETPRALTAAEMLSGMGEAAAPNAPVLDSGGRAHDPSTGQFTAAETPPPAAEAAGAETPGAPAAEAAATDPAEATPAAEPAAVDEATITLTEDHPLFRRFGAEVKVPKAHEELFRFAFNQPVVRHELREAQVLAQAAQDLAEEQRIRFEAQRAVTRAVLRDPGLAPEIQRIEEARAQLGDDVADAYIERLLANLEQPVEERGQRFRSEAEQARQVQALNALETEFVSNTKDRYWFASEEDVGEALGSFGLDWAHRAQRGLVQGLPTLEAFVQFADQRMAAHPRWQQHVRERDARERQEAIARAETEAATRKEAEIRAEMERAALARQQNPHTLLGIAAGDAPRAPGVAPVTKTAAEILAEL